MTEKIAFAGIGALVFSLLGKVDWLLIFYGICMCLDYISGTLSAIKAKEWSASKAAQGIWKKVGSIFAVITGSVLDLLFLTVGARFPDIEFISDYKPVFCCLVLVWYIVTELGSIAENAGKMGTPLPKFLSSHLSSIKKALDDDSSLTKKKDNTKKK